MAYEEKYKTTEMQHTIIMESRAHLSITGVEDVESFDDSEIVLYTSKGMLIIRGRQLQIEKLNLDGGDLKVDGEIESLEYQDASREKGGFWSRFMK